MDGAIGAVDAHQGIGVVGRRLCFLGGVGLVSMPALRFAGVGPGALLLAIWAMWIFAEVLLRRRPVPDITRWWCALWLPVFGALLAGMLLAPTRPGYPLGNHPHNALALLLVAPVCIAASIEGADRRGATGSIRSAGQAVLMLAILQFLVTLPIHTAEAHLGWQVTGYQWRFQGLGSNPNQTAMFLLFGIALLAAGIHRWDPLLRAGSMALVSAGWALGWLTRSDAFTLAVGAGFLVGIAVYWCEWTFPRYREGRKSRRRMIGCALGVGALVVVIIAGGVLGPLWWEDVYHRAGNFVQGSNRLDLTLHGLAAWADSPWVGHGPGGFSGNTAPYQGKESHNSVVDLLTNVGLIGTVPCLFLVVGLFALALRARLAFVAGAMSAIICFSMFHVVWRQPLFWLVLVGFAFRVRGVPDSGSREDGR